MICGDIVFVLAGIQGKRTIVPVRVQQIERDCLVLVIDTKLEPRLAGSGMNGVVLRVRKKDRGVWWSPSWIEHEVEALRVTSALGDWFV